MAHWAKLDQDNFVVKVIVTDNNDPNNDEGYKWITENLGGTWVKTSYNGNIRKNFAGVGFVYDVERDAFIAPKPFDSWVLNEETAKWESPIPKPDLNVYWDEESLYWVELDPQKI